MTTEERIQRQKELVETAGRYYDKKGLQPIAGRIIGLLTIMDKERFTFDEIVEELNVSKSSVSNALRILEMANSIEYITLPGDRKRYFQLKKTDKFAMIDEYKSALSEVKTNMQAIVELKANPQSENSVFLRNLIDMLDFFLSKFEELKQEYSISK